MPSRQEVEDLDPRWHVTEAGNAQVIRRPGSLHLTVLPGDDETVVDFPHLVPALEVIYHRGYDDGLYLEEGIVENQGGVTGRTGIEQKSRYQVGGKHRGTHAKGGQPAPGQ